MSTWYVRHWVGSGDTGITQATLILSLLQGSSGLDWEVFTPSVGLWAEKTQVHVELERVSQPPKPPPWRQSSSSPTLGRQWFFESVQLYMSQCPVMSCIVEDGFQFPYTSEIWNFWKTAHVEFLGLFFLFFFPLLQNDLNFNPQPWLLALIDVFRGPSWLRRWKMKHNWS